MIELNRGLQINKTDPLSRGLAFMHYAKEAGGRITNNLALPGHYGNFYNSPTWSYGPNGSCLSIPDTGDNEIHYPHKNEICASEITILAYIKCQTDGSYHGIIEKLSGTTGMTFIAQPYNNRLAVYAKFGGVWGQEQSGYAYSDLLNEWHQVGIRMNAPNTLYWIKNGRIVDSDTTNGTLDDWPTSDIIVGGTYDFGGLMDYVAWWNRPLKDSEIMNFYRDPKQIIDLNRYGIAA